MQIFKEDTYVINILKDYKIATNSFILLLYIGNYLAVHKSPDSWSKMSFPQSFMSPLLLPSSVLCFR